MSASLTQIAYSALRDLGCLRPGQSTSPDVLNDIKQAANDLIDQLQIDELMIFTIAIQAFNLTAGLQTYTIGPSEVAPNLTAARPTKIEEANIIINTVSPTVRMPLDLLTDKEWSLIRVQQIPFALPRKLYYDYGFDPTRGYGTIFLWPGPLSSYQLELFTWQQLQAFPDLTTVLKFPPGYQNMIRKNLAVEIAPMMRMYGKIPGPGGIRGYDENMLALVVEQARQTKADLQSYNAPDPGLPTDPSFSQGGRKGAYSYVLGEPS